MVMLERKDLKDQMVHEEISESQDLLESLAEQDHQEVREIMVAVEIKVAPVLTVKTVNVENPETQGFQETQVSLDQKEKSDNKERMDAPENVVLEDKWETKDQLEIQENLELVELQETKELLENQVTQERKETEVLKVCLENQESWVVMEKKE
jgi:hypothetical protein